MKAKELRDMNDAELVEKVQTSSASELFGLRFQTPPASSTTPRGLGRPSATSPAR